MSSNEYFQARVYIELTKMVDQNKRQYNNKKIRTYLLRKEEQMNFRSQDIEVRAWENI